MKLFGFTHIGIISILALIDVQSAFATTEGQVTPPAPAAAARDYCDGRPLLGMTTTVYYNPVMTTEKVNCGGRRWVRTGRRRGYYVQSQTPTYNVIVDYQGRKIRDCKTIRAALKMQGSATVFENFDANGRPSRASAIYKVTGGGAIGLEKLNPDTACPAGYGRNNICLNPFKMVAAPPGYKAGEVIHVPELNDPKNPFRYPEYPGQPEAEWATHNGDLIVGDSGSAIQANSRHGLGRFDFYAGLIDWRDPKNPFRRGGFGKSTNKKFCKVDAVTANEVRQANSFPKFPQTLMAGWLNGPSQDSSSRNQMADAKPKAPKAAAPKIQLTEITGVAGFGDDAAVAR